VQARRLQALQANHKPQTSGSKICREGVAYSDYAHLPHATCVGQNIGAIRSEFLEGKLKFLPLRLYCK
jgi:hypothetical protein